MTKFHKRVCVINGPNLNLLGLREPSLYGNTPLSEIIDKLLTLAATNQTELVHFQSNHEGALIDFINAQYVEFLQNPHTSLAFIVNFAAYSHTSIALLDALAMFPEKTVPIFEVHISNIFERESFRRHSFVSKIARETIVGLGANGYEMALLKILDVFKSF